MTDFLVPTDSVLPSEAEATPDLSSWVLRITASPDQRVPRLRQATQVLAAMQQLVEIVQGVRSPDGGWDPDRPATPENLLPYVFEEASDLLDALESTLDSFSRRPSEGAESWLSQDLWQNYCLAEDFAPQLLWGIARSAYGVMRLLEGVRAIVQEDGRSPRESHGIVRMTALLQIRIADHSQTIDLVTHHPPEMTLDTTVPIQLLEGYPMTEPRPAGELLQGFVQQIRMTTPAVLSFLNGVAVTGLTPQHRWQTGTLQLKMGLEFIPDYEVTRAAVALPQSVPILKFTDTVWLEAYRTTVLQQYLATLIPQLSAYQNMAQADLPPLADDILPLLVQNACEVANLLESAPPFLAQRPAEAGVPLADLLPWLLWCVSRSAYEVMYLIGGLRCRLLQPGQAWQSGLLRLLLTLKVSTPEHDWYFDLATGHMPEPDVFPLEPDVVVQLPSRLGGSQPCLIEQWQSRVMAAIESATPELRFLLEGTAVDILTREAEAVPALVQLLVDFDFLADLQSS
ncbi:hypothetical protein [Leptolyngbya sp. FACHB-8]|uniref:hypothetical protein n=1 Tax=unclassified Leptolyngbya TaxID=2650499 RepID=UPI001684EEA4|nr:hypothetical protein [Leptolyngbya sp. FACHB-8]MBD1911981.1 hypothetical protein [Leptolyngbya sp. FACHB-8]